MLRMIQSLLIANCGEITCLMLDTTLAMLLPGNVPVSNLGI